MRSTPSPLMPRATKPRLFKRLAALSATALVATTLVASGAAASHPEASLAGSNFEIDVDANLKVDDPAPSLDWANVTETRATDKVNGTGDNSYAGGVKEDTSCPGEVTDSIPPNKSDLLSFHVYREAGTGTHPGFLNLAWSRVSDPSGTTLMDFEFNQSSTKCASGPNVVRTAGDLLIEYAIDQGGSRADISARRWTGTAWGPTTDLDVPSATCGGAPCAAGTINSSPIPAADSDGLIASGSKQARTFGEAQLDLRLLFQPNKCTSFGSAMLKSRSSDSFTSQLKDFVAPVGINLQNCGQVIIRKQTLPDEDPNATNFGYTKAFSTDPTSANTFTLQDDGVKDYGKTVLFGSGYTVVEDVIPSDWSFVSVNCDASTGVTPSINGATVTFAINEDTDVLDCTYTNELQLGALKILKNSTKGGAVTNPGAVFSYDGTSVTDNGTGDQDPDVGEVCVSGLSLGDYDVTETSPPPGYADAPGGAQTVTVVSGTNCTDNQPTGAAVATFTNAPLADIQVNFRDGGSGETSLTSMTCENTGVTPDTGTATGWDDTITHEGIAIDPSPRTVTCTIVIDP
ncbi:collagen binding domain-containing protein [Nocardioides sp. NPDC087217]|uniref:MSCRAMM family protein n=1 Tax=Nocardioides sp. NPDC087217 TaxID=3364335 RepID=UPI0038268C25